MPELGPATTDAELDDLLAQIDKEVSLDPELSQDLLEFLDEENEGDEDDETVDCGWPRSMRQIQSGTTSCASMYV